MKRIYVAAPYTKGDVGVNVRRAIDVSDELACAGFAVFCPLLTHFWHLVHPHEYQFWFTQDMVWLRQCQAMVYIKGESNGVEEEKKVAAQCGIPIFEYHSKGTVRDLTNLDLFSNQEKFI